jgi:integrase
MATTKKTNGNGIREPQPGKFLATMYDPRVKGKTRHIGTFTAPPQPDPQYRTRRLAEKAAKQAKQEAEELRDLQMKGGAKTPTVASFAGRWCSEDYRRPAETTNRHNAERVKALVKDFGERPLHGITPQEARLWVHGGIAPEEIRHIAQQWDGSTTDADGDVHVKEHKGNHLAVRAMFNDAIQTGPPVWVGGPNPFSSLKVPEAEGRRGDNITVLDEAELALLVSTIHDVLGDYGHHFGALVETLAWTGLRPGEAWALQVDAHPRVDNWVDWQAGELHVTFQIDRFGKRRHTKWDKKGKGRTVFLLPEARSALERAIDGRPNGEVFYTTRGLAMSNGTAGYYWGKVRSAFWAKLPEERRSATSEKQGGPEPGKIAIDFDLYEMRHFFGTTLAEMGMPAPEIADQMGHKDGGALAMERYIHPRKDAVKRSMLERHAEWRRRQQRRNGGEAAAGG